MLMTILTALRDEISAPEHGSWGRASHRGTLRCCAEEVTCPVGTRPGTDRRQVVKWEEHNFVGIQIGGKYFIELVWPHLIGTQDQCYHVWEAHGLLVWKQSRCDIPQGRFAEQNMVEDCSTVDVAY